jgi:putative pyruvate formate lyase activating enzyme
LFESAYIKTLRDGAFPGKIDRGREMLRECRVCPRSCGVDRLNGETGFCGVADLAVVCSASPHFGEESPLVGVRGSGTIFLTSCNLKCQFCQNYEISHLMEGAAVESADLGELMLELQDAGCHNINFVTPSHVAPQILEGVFHAAQRGLTVPLVYNTGGYDSLETLRLLDGVVDIYMPDLKFMDSGVSKELMNAADYPEAAKNAIREMHRQVGDLEIDDRGVATRGLLVRHLVLPGDLADTREAMRFLARDISPNTYVNVMDQYRPCGNAHRFSSIRRRITRDEYNKALEMAREEGVARLDDRVRFRLLFF